MIFIKVPSFVEAVDHAGERFHSIQILRKKGPGVERLGLEPAFAEVEDGKEGRRIKGEVLVQEGEGIALREGGVAAGDEQDVAAEVGEGGNGIGHKTEQEVVVVEDARGFLAEAEELGAELIFELGAVVAGVDLEGGDEVFAVQDFVAAADVVELDGEAVGGGGELVAGEKQRGGIVLLAPPAEDGLGEFELGEGEAGEDAKDVEVGVAGVVIAGGGGAVEDDGEEG
jgi:hypothetical protein